MVTYLLANFGGPRTSQEIVSFLQALLTDRDVTGGMIPSVLHRPLFSYIAKRRAPHVARQYAYLGGGSPIFQDTERLAQTSLKNCKLQLFLFIDIYQRLTGKPYRHYKKAREA